MNQIWETPELVVLVQGRNDERVLLTGCKGSGGNGPDVAVYACTELSSECETCVSCSIEGLS
jgi:hypothetical protein